MNPDNPGNEKEEVAKRRGSGKFDAWKNAYWLGAIGLALVVGMAIGEMFVGWPIVDARRDEARAQACSLWFNGINDPVKAPAYCGVPEMWRGTKAAPSALPSSPSKTDESRAVRVCGVEGGVYDCKMWMERVADLPPRSHAAWTCESWPNPDGTQTRVCVDTGLVNR